MLFKQDEYIITVSPEGNYYSVRVKLIGSVPLDKVLNALRTYGIQFEEVNEEFMSYVVYFVCDKVNDLELASTVDLMKFDLQSSQETLIFFNEGQNRLRMFLKNT